MTIVTTIVAKIVAYLTSIWGVARLVFGHLPVQVMEDIFGLLCVIFLISIIDGLPSMIKRKKDDEYEYILVKKRGR